MGGWRRSLDGEGLEGLNKRHVTKIKKKEKLTGVKTTPTEIRRQIIVRGRGGGGCCCSDGGCAV